ncbi:hypothetical protein [Ideonella sp. A 288]|uniref:hypothetical protein n=1 Tax=Ideonella sp. A 288 TaxID=1962181 RepID=UPI0011850950|nr:hypothetical protein [Ideonella sp. A 288]
MAIPTSELKKWGLVWWQTNFTHAVPSKGGAVGVMFVWCTNPLYQGVDIDDPRTADFVIKPSAGSAAPTLLAEDLMKRTIGATSVNTLPIASTDSRFNAILMGLSRFKDRVDQSVNSPRTPQVTQAMRDLKDRWAKVWPHYRQGRALMVQELAVGMNEFADVYRDYSHMGLERALFNDQLMRNIGKLFAVDAVLGNGDRLCQVNTGNILFHETTKQIFSVDSQAIMTSYQHALIQGERNAKSWVEQILLTNQGASAVPERDGVVAPPSFSMNDLYDLDRWWNTWFRGHIENTLHYDNQKKPRDTLWQHAFRNFSMGVNEGLMAVDRQLSGLNWLSVKSLFKSHEKRYGASPNLDWTNFKIRRMVVRMVLAERNKPGTPQEKQQRAMDRVVAYAERKIATQHV